MKVEYAGYAGACPGAYPNKKSVAGQFAAVKYGGTWLVTLTVRHSSIQVNPVPAG